jgi:alkaline phosphatase
MKSRFFSFLITTCCAVSIASAQSINSSNIFSHNDYKNPVPFYQAYDLQVGYIEADVFLLDGNLLVAHEAKELDNTKTLETLYLKPLQEKILQNNGTAYADATKSLALMIDLKTEGTSTLKALSEKLSGYPALIQCTSLKITVSGNMPPPGQWSNYPNFIHFDGRPNITYNEEQWKRITLVSSGLREYTLWNGKGLIPQLERDRINEVIKFAHDKNKPVRFWAMPDFVNAWIKLMDMKIDVFNTDHVPELADFFKSYSQNSYRSQSIHTVYTPQYNRSKWKPTPKNVILLIGDGTGLAQWYSAYTANHGKLNIFQLNDIGFSITTSADSYNTDSAAGATAMATGTKTNNRFVGVDSIGKPLTTIAEKCKLSKFNVGIISNGDITDATPASFYAHKNERSLSEAIALDFMSSDFDVLIGGGEKSFNARKDNRDLLKELSKKNYTTSTSFQSIDGIKDKRFVVLEDAAVVSKMKGRGDFLSKSLSKTTSIFASQGQPFFIMEEGAQIDWGGHENNMEYVVREALDFDQAIGEAMKFVDQNNETLLIITADHETGGLTLLNGTVSQGFVLGKFSTNDHTGITVPVFAYGPGADHFRGVYQNAEIYNKLAKLLSIH